jgi:type IV secretory pathway VirJ component
MGAGKILTATIMALAATAFPGRRTLAAVADTTLPVVVLGAVADSSAPMVLLITGDGGWKDFDPELARQFVARKIPVVALNALHYFWDKKTPAQSAAAVTRLLDTYMARWHRHTFLLAGFSFGADVMPFIANRLPSPLMRQCRGIALFSPGTSTDFEIHLSQMLNSHHQWPYDVVTELEAMKPVRLVCFFGTEEHGFPVQALNRPGWQVVYLAGGHHYTDNKQDVAVLVLQKLGLPVP